MSKYEKFSPQNRMQGRPWAIHPVWQGIGCVLMILIPVMAYAGAVLLVQANMKQNWVPLPPEMLQAVTIPGIARVDHLYANLLTAAMLAMLGFAMVFAIYSFVYKMVGPSQYGPLDAPPANYRFKARKRR